LRVAWSLAWTLRSLPVERLAAALGWPRERIAAVESFKQTLLEKLLQHARPE
jgi:hypothetical protein